MTSSLKISKTNIGLRLLPKHCKYIILRYERADVVFQLCSGNV